MAQLSKFRNVLLLPRHSSSPLFLSKPFNVQFRSLLTVIGSSKRHRTIPPLRRKSTTPTPMEVNESSFNKRRAEGRDSGDAPRKNLQLKVRKLNPINTISYVQVSHFLSKFSFLSQNGYLFCLITILLSSVFNHRYWELEWILRIRLLQSCFSSTIKGLYSMLER